MMASKVKRHVWAAMAVVVAGLLFGGCSAADQDQELVVLCGGSFRPPAEDLVRRYQEESGRTVNLSYGQSEDLLPQVKLRTAGDLFISHDPFVKYTEDAGSMLRYIQVGYVAPVLVTARGNPKQIQRIEDLAKPNLRVVLTDPKFSTCGEMVYRLLDKKKIKEPVLANVGNALVRSHSQVATPIKLGHADAGIMWNGMAHEYLDALEIVPTPYEYDEEIRVAVMGLSYSKHREEVEHFLGFVEKHGPEVFSKFGYVKSSGPKDEPSK